MTLPAALPIFGDAYLADTQHLTLEEHGAYFKLLLIAWRTPQCALPDDDKRIATMLGVTTKKWASIRPTIMAFWSLTANGWEQKRLSKERRYVAEKSGKNSRAAKTRWQDNSLKSRDAADANADASAYANGDAPPPPPKNSLAPLDRAREAGDDALDEVAELRRAATDRGRGKLPPTHPRCFEVATHVSALADFVVPPNDGHLVNGWLVDGIDPEGVIYPAVERLVARKRERGERVRKFKLLDLEVRAAVAAITQATTATIDLALRRLPEGPNPAWEARQRQRARSC